jgi:hypothetical protein
MLRRAFDIVATDSCHPKDTRCRHYRFHGLLRRDDQARPVAISQVQPEQVGVGGRVKFPAVAAGTPRRQGSGCCTPGSPSAIPPMPDSPNGNSAYQGILTVDNAKLGQEKGEVNGVPRVHASIVYRGTDNSVELTSSAGSGIRTRKPFRADAFEAPAFAVSPSRRFPSHGQRPVADKHGGEERANPIYLIRVRFCGG